MTKRRRRWRVVACASWALLGAAADAAGQSALPPDSAPIRRRAVQVGVAIAGAVPLGAFAENVEESVGGFALHLGVGHGSGLVSIGGEFAYLNYGHESRKEPFSPNVPDVVLTINTDNEIILFHGRVRLQPVRNARVMPYVDGLFGLNSIYTTTSIEGLSSDQGSGASTTNVQDVRMSVGAGAGVMIGLGQLPARTRLDLSARFMSGGEASYLKQGAIRRENGQAILDLTRSRTDLVGVYMGLTWEFGSGR